LTTIKYYFILDSMSNNISIQSLIDKHQSIQTSKLNKDFVSNTDAWLRMELTYTSNSIEGNTLTRQEVALVVNDNLSVAGKDINEMVEISNHEKAINYILTQSQLIQLKDISEDLVLGIHSILLNNIDDSNAGKYRSVPVRISGSMTVPPNYLKVKDLMTKLIDNSKDKKKNFIQTAIDMHYELVSIHPFIDGNGRTARLLFNLIMMINNFPFVYITKEDRSQYLKSLEKAQTGGSKNDYEELMLKSVDRSLSKYFNSDEDNSTTKVFKIGELSKITNIPISTIRYWFAEELITSFNQSKGGYSLFNSDTINRLQNIQKLKIEKRMSIQEIKNLLK
jgi:Fic family protein